MKIKMICNTMQWETDTTIKYLQYLSDNYHPIEGVDLYLDIALHLGTAHIDWSKYEFTQEEVLLNLYKGTKNLKFKRVYITVVSTDELSGHIDLLHNMFSSYYDGYISITPNGADCHPLYLDIMIDMVKNTNHKYTWISPPPNEMREDKIDKETDIIEVIRIPSTGYCMGYLQFDYISYSIIDLVDFPPFEGYGPQDSFTGFIMTEIYRRFPNLDYGHYYIINNTFKKGITQHIIPSCIKINKIDQRTLAEKDFFDIIGKRTVEVIQKLRDRNEV